MKTILCAMASSLVALTSWATGAAGDPVADFYKGKQMTLFIGSAEGGGYDSYARVVGRHLGRNLPGQPSLVVKNMPGAGSLNMTNHIYNHANKDGTEIGAPQNGVVFEPVFHLLAPGGKNARFEATKFNWLGSADAGVYVLVAWQDAPVKKFDDLYATELLVGSSGANTDNSVLAEVLNGLFATKLKVITGYQGSRGVALAMERGEVKGAAGMAYASIKTANPQWIEEKKINVLIQMGIDPQPELKGVPFALDIAKTPDDRRALEVIFAKYKMSRPYFAPPGVPAERVKALQTAFMATMKDGEFLAEAKKQRLDINPVSGQDIQDLVQKIYQTPEPLLAKVRKLIGAQ